MRILKSFEEFLEVGIVKRRTPDISRARSLLEEAEKRHKFLDEVTTKIGLSDKNANYFVEASYDILISLLRAKLLADGFSSSGEGAHEAEVSYMHKLNFPESDIRFMNDLRFFRNGIKYYGEEFDSEYAKKVLGFLGTYYSILKEIVVSSG